jgi:hypothetical protein
MISQSGGPPFRRLIAGGAHYKPFQNLRSIKAALPKVISYLPLTLTSPARGEENNEERTFGNHYNK